MKIRNLLMALIAIVAGSIAAAQPVFTLQETIKSLSSDYPGEVKVFQVEDGSYSYTVKSFPGKELVKFPSYKPSREYENYWASLVKQGLANTYLAYRADLWQKFNGQSVDNNVYPGAWRTVSAMTPVDIPCRPMIYGSRPNGGVAEGFTQGNKLEKWGPNSNSYSFLLTGRVWEQFSASPQCLAYFVSQFNLVRDGQNGKDGKNGNDGRNGRDGIDGRSVVRVNIEDNQWVVYYSDGDKEVLGAAPRNGENGANGINGTNGVSVTGAVVNEQGNLILTLSNESKIDAGNVMGKNGKDGAVGPQGPQGPAGPQGPQGPAGANTITEVGTVSIVELDRFIEVCGKDYAAHLRDGNVQEARAFQFVVNNQVVGQWLWYFNPAERLDLGEGRVQLGAQRRCVSWKNAGDALIPARTTQRSAEGGLYQYWTVNLSNGGDVFDQLQLVMSYTPAQPGKNGGRLQPVTGCLVQGSASCKVELREIAVASK